VITPVADPSQVAHARRLATGSAAELGFDAEAVGRVAIVVTELATNLLKHAGEGEIVWRHYADVTGEGIEILSLDRGPGMADVARCLEDGFSTVGSRGNGLGAVRRLARSFGVFSRPGQGTAVLARLGNDARRPAAPGGVISALLAVCPGETVSGDACEVRLRPGGARAIVADGSGHGVLAAEAAQRAIEVFRAEPDRPLELLADSIHRALAPTRGAAIGLIDLDIAAAQARFVGVGNIAATLFDAGGAKKLVSMNGTAGRLAPRLREFAYPLASVAPTCVLHSDGIATRWDLAAYPGLLAAHPALIAGILYRDFRRGRDDATVVALRLGPA
jgi:anti-sigma regulatory factor (Ser/Thr protein kinase)